MLTTRVSYNHRDASFFTDNNLGRLAEADVFDLNLTLSPSQGPWSFSIYGNNLTNDVSFGGVSPLPDSPLFGGDGPGGVLGPPRAAPLNEGRVWGAELRLRF
jgi:iron complex outermembrane receptor protein